MNVGRVYLPGGQTAYDAAVSGKVALTFWTSLFADAGQNAGTFHIENIHEYLVAQGQIPYTIAVFLNDDLSPIERIKKLKATTLPALKAAFSKISDDPAYRMIAGQSTAGANSFDTVWMGTDIVSKGIGGSPSLVCFGCHGGLGNCPSVDPNCTPKNDAYSTEIAFCPARKIRWSATVGTCDIFGTLADRLAAGCGGDSGAGGVDASTCKATWLTANRDVANAMKTKGMPYQLFVVSQGGHTPSTWGGIALAYQLRWVFKDTTFAM